MYHSFSFHCNTSRPMLDYCISKLSLGVVRTAYDAMREAMHREAEGAIVGPAPGHSRGAIQFIHSELVG